MRKRLLTIFTLLALTTQIFMVFAYAGDSVNDTYAQEPSPSETEGISEDPLSQDNDIMLLEEDTITFDSFTTRNLLEGETLRKGVDVSEWQYDIDWEKVKNDGVDFAFIRVGYRGIMIGSLAEDKYYEKNLKEALAQGIQVGVYIYSQAITVDEAVEEADYVLSRIQDYNISLPVVLDYEYGYINGKPGRLKAANLSKSQATEICNAFLDRVESQGYYGIVYANRNFFYTQLNRDKLGSVWLAHYALETDYQGDYAFWQCTSSGRVDGIRGYTDLDFWFDDGTYQSPLPFRDVSIRAWSYDSIRFAYQTGMVQGVSKSEFAPDADAIRGDVVTMLYRMMDEPEQTEKSPFTDLDRDYYESPVAWAYNTGVIMGRTDTTFDPSANITRQELVSMLYRMAGNPESTTSLSQFPDEKQVAAYAVPAMAWAVENGILQGNQVGEQILLDPTGTATREQIATIFTRYEQLIK